MMKHLIKTSRQFWPLLVLYAVIVLFFGQNHVIGDEERYLWLAENLSRGFFSPSDELYLWSGPGYPLFLLPFQVIGLPLLAIKFVNAILAFLSVLLVYDFSKLILSEHMSYYCTLAFGLYWPPWRLLPMAYSETFSMFLITVLVWSIYKIYHGDNKRTYYQAGSAIALAWLMLTKAIFAFVLPVTLLISCIASLVHKTKSVILIRIQIIALVLCIPYLIYTYSLTDRIYYWASAGGMSLYWMSTPFQGEYGSWQNHDLDASFERSCTEMTVKLDANHGEFISSIQNLDQVSRDRHYIKKAVEHIQNHPVKYLQNWLCNLSRMLFGTPFSYMKESPRSLFYSIPNSAVLVAFLFLFPAFFKNRRKIPFALRTTVIFMGVYLFGSSLLSAYPRIFYIQAPIFIPLIFWGIETLRSKYKAGHFTKP